MKKLLFLLPVLAILIATISPGIFISAKGGPKTGSMSPPPEPAEMPGWTDAEEPYRQALFIKTGPDCEIVENLTQVGFVQAWITGENLFVRFYTNGPLFDNELLETHLKVAMSLEDLGKPIPGQFPYGEEYTVPRQDVVYEVPLASLGIEPGDPLPSSPIFIAGHAVVQGEGIDQETAWSNCKHFPGVAKWAHYWKVDNITTLEWPAPPAP